MEDLPTKTKQRKECNPMGKTFVQQWDNKGSKKKKKYQYTECTSIPTYCMKLSLVNDPLPVTNICERLHKLHFCNFLATPGIINNTSKTLWCLTPLVRRIFESEAWRKVRDISSPETFIVHIISWYGKKLMTCNHGSSINRFALICLSVCWL